MKIVAQVVRNATLKIDNTLYSSIDYGLLLLVSFTHGDTEEDVYQMVDKVVKMRILPDKDGKTNLDIRTAGAQILSVSQFTLYAAFNGRRPSFTNTLPLPYSRDLYDLFNAELAKSTSLQKGEFGAHMDITFTNVGPITYILESDER